MQASKTKQSSRRKLIDPAKADGSQLGVVWSIMKRSKLNDRCLNIVETARKLQELIDDTREVVEGELYADFVAAGLDPMACDIGSLAHVDDDCGGFVWVLEQFIQAMSNNFIPRSEADYPRLYGDDEPEVKVSPARARRAATTGGKSR